MVVSVVRRLLRGVIASMFVAVAGAGALVVSFWLEHRTEVTLPTPTGSLAVGRAIDHWTDDAIDALAPVPGTKRELAVWIWYPAATPQSPAAADEYIPAAWRVAVERARGAPFRLLTRDLAKVHPHSIRDAAISPRQRSYPVVIMRGGASAEVFNYATLAEDLASHGYVVVGFDAPYRSNVVVFPDGRVVRRAPENNPERCLERSGAERARCVSRILGAWVGDIRFVLDRLQQLNASDPAGRFTGRLDPTRVGVFGHSFGGATALQFCSVDPRCKAGIDIDGAPVGSVVQTGLQQPFMFLFSDHTKESDAEANQVRADVHAIYDRLPQDKKSLIVIRGANHFLFADDWALLKSRIVLRMLRLFGVVGIDGRRQLGAAAFCVHSFFDAYLKEPGASPPLDVGSPAYPEIQHSNTF